MDVDIENTRLGVPGPVNVHPRVLRALAKPVYYHRTPEFRKIYGEVLEMYNEIIGGKNALTTAFMGTGTAAMEAAVAYMVDENTTVISLVNGKFSHRLMEIAKRHSKNVIVKEYERGKAVKPEDVEELISDNPGAVVTLTHNETSTAVLNPLPEIIKVVHKYDGYVIADGITSVGGDYVFFDKREIDVLISGSQKCLGMPPGLSFVSLSERARERVNEIYRERGKPYYVDLVKHIKKAQQNDTPYTASVSLIYAAHEALKMILEEGLEARVMRHRKVGETFRRAFPKLGLKLFAEKGYYSNTVTAALPPEGISAEDIRKRVLEKGIIIAGGQERLKGKIIRVSHMNLTNVREVIMILGALDLSLKELGHKHDPGKRMESVYEVRL